jgi:hypothetical protein
VVSGLTCVERICDMRTFILTALLLLAGCTNPRLSTGVVITPDGVYVRPTLSGEIGDATVSVQP